VCKCTNISGILKFEVKNIYPAGEGAGYAGGIMSSAIDGLRAAENILATIKDIILLQ
jgi:uncharacterized FAD-dependent dehydrogenase